MLKIYYYNVKHTKMGAFVDEKLKKNLKMEPNLEIKSKATEEKFTDESNDQIEVSEKKIENAIDKSGNVDISSTKIHLSFSVDRLLKNEENNANNVSKKIFSTCDLKECCEQQHQNISFCTHPGCLLPPNSRNILETTPQFESQKTSFETECRPAACPESSLQGQTTAFLDFANKCIVRPLPIRALNGNNCENDLHFLPSLSTTLATTSLLQRLYHHQQQQQQQKQTFPQPHHNVSSLPYTSSMPTTSSTPLSPLLITPLTCNLKSLQLHTHAAAMATAIQQQHQHQLQNPKQQHFRITPAATPGHFTKSKLPLNHIDIPTSSNGHFYHTIHPMQSLHHQQLTQAHQNSQQQLQHQAMLTHLQLNNSSGSGISNSGVNAIVANTQSNNNNNGNGGSSHNHNSITNNNGIIGNNSSSSSGSNQHHSQNNGKRKRSWSRAVFSNLQRKGLEIQFQQQKYITKPDRRKLAARLNLTDAQVKVWFQNRRMKWRHTRENLKSGQEKQPANLESMHSSRTSQKVQSPDGMQHEMDYLSDGGSDSSMAISENEDECEIDVVE